MKKVFLFILLIATVFMVGAQNSGLPDAVDKAFQQKFPKAKKVRWSPENIDDYQAEFEMDSVSAIAQFTQTGSWIQTGINLPVNKLDQKIATTIKKKYDKSRINKVTKIQHVKKQPHLEIELKIGESLEYVYYDEGGNEITSFK